MPAVSGIETDENAPLIMPRAKSPVHDLFEETEQHFKFPYADDSVELKTALQTFFEHRNNKTTIYNHNENIKLKFNSLVLQLQVTFDPDKAGKLAVNEAKKLELLQHVILYAWFLNYYFCHLHHSPTQQALINKKTTDCLDGLVKAHPELPVVHYKQSLPTAANNADYFRLNPEVNDEQQPSYFKWLQSWVGVRFLRTCFIPRTNWLRLLIVRVGRVLGTTAALWPSELIQVAAAVVGVTGGIVFKYLSWVYYLPRLFVNLTLMLKHTAGPWVAPHLRDLTWQERLNNQWELRKFQIRNDAVWFANGLTVFILGIVLGPILGGAIGCILISALYLFDVWNSRKDLKDTSKHTEGVMIDLDNGIGATAHCANVIKAKKFDYKVTVILAVAMFPLLIKGAMTIAVVIASGTAAAATMSFPPLLLAILAIGAFTCVATTVYQYYKHNIAKAFADKADEVKVAIPVPAQAETLPVAVAVDACATMERLSVSVEQQAAIAVNDGTLGTEQSPREPDEQRAVVRLPADVVVRVSPPPAAVARTRAIRTGSIDGAQTQFDSFTGRPRANSDPGPRDHSRIPRNPSAHDVPGLADVKYYTPREQAGGGVQEGNITLFANGGRAQSTQKPPAKSVAVI